jgi:hypothetical protein
MLTHKTYTHFTSITIFILFLLLSLLIEQQYELPAINGRDKIIHHNGDKVESQLDLTKWDFAKNRPSS